MTTDARRVLVLVEQLRGRVPGGIGTYVGGLLDADAAASVPILRPWASGPIGRASRSMHLPSPLATRLVDHGLVRWPSRVADGAVTVGHATSLLVPARRRGQPPVTVFVHDLAWRSHPETFTASGRAWHEAAFGRACQRADRFFVPSTATADALTSAGVGARLVHVTLEGADHLTLKPRNPGEYLLSVSTLEPRKNLNRLLQAYVRSGVTVPLKIVGPKGWGDGFGETVPAGVELVGVVTADRLADLYAGALALLYVPLVEGFGLPAVEAMRAGCPVIASAVPSVGSAALVLDPLDVGAIADAIKGLVESEPRREELAEAGKAHVAGLTWSACLAAHREGWSALCLS